jgi:putative endonuclease
MLRAARRHEMNDWSLYVIRTHAGALYTGIAKDVDRRIDAHRTTRGAKYLRGRGPLALVYQRKIGDRSLASRVEYALKQLNKAEKEALIAARPSRRRLLRTLDLARA